MRLKSKIPNVEMSDSFKSDIQGMTDGFLYISPSKAEVLAYIDLRFSGTKPEFNLRCKICNDVVRAYSDLDRPTSPVSCDCTSRMLRDVEAMKDKELKSSFEFSICCVGEQWPVKVDRLTSPAGLTYTGTRGCTIEEAIGYFTGSFYESKKRGFRKANSQ